MSQLSVLTGIVGLCLLLAMVEMLRRRRLREKYAVLWLVVGIVALPFAFFPRLFDAAARWLGIASGVSLVLFLALVFLLLVCVHLSWEISQLEEETRVLAEEVALIRAKQESSESRDAAAQDA